MVMGINRSGSSIGHPIAVLMVSILSLRRQMLWSVDDVVEGERNLKSESGCGRLPSSC
jgi:hypothetical protein